MYTMDHPRYRPPPGIHASRLVYPLSQHAPPQLWEYAQPYIDNLLRNAWTLRGLSPSGISRIGQPWTAIIRVFGTPTTDQSRCLPLL